MRSRYSAFAVGDEAYLRRTWHPSTRPRRIGIDPDTRWTGLEILGATTDGDAATVEFRAHHDGGVLHEDSRFVREGGNWLYVDGQVS